MNSVLGYFGSVFVLTDVTEGCVPVYKCLSNQLIDAERGKYQEKIEKRGKQKISKLLTDAEPPTSQRPRQIAHR